MRTIYVRTGDAAQLREELSQKGLAGLAVSDADAQGRIGVSVPDDIDGALVERVLQAHFPRSITAAIAAVDFEGVDFDSPTTLAGLKQVLNQHKLRCIELRNRTARALRARWE